ncbi:MAG: chemotaxis protein, partial [Alphaproteobacteria bacterium]|nr:chemotaxis protein [Alphaproteobacteria bacterium]
MPGTIRRRRQAFDIWPGFVDALSALLIIIIFLLMVFTLAQFFLGEILSGRNQALERLNRQVAELSEMLSLERSANAGLREDIVRLTTDLQASTAAREQLSGQLAELLPQRDALQAELEAARETIETDRDKIAAQLSEIARINRDIKALQTVRAELEKKVSELAATIAERDRSITALRDRSKELEAKLSSEQERTALVQKEIGKKDL